jgi:hypothetical protein
MTAHVPSLKDLTLPARPDDAELHRAARKALYAGEHEVFRMLPGLLDQLIQRKVWKSRNFASFGQYALSQTSEGLAITNNQQLWMLKCALDVNDKHIKAWASVLQEVEKCVRVYAREEGVKLKEFRSNSLETLAKSADDSRQKITYLPSYARHNDYRLVRQQGSRRPDSDVNRDPVARAIMYVKRMEPTDIKRLVKWLTEEGYVK